jgi:hypothetical protein
MIYLEGVPAVGAIALGAAAKFFHGVAKDRELITSADRGAFIVGEMLAGAFYFAGLVLIAQAYLNAR